MAVELLIDGVNGFAENAAKTGDWAGAASPEQQVEPLGMPAKKGLAPPETVVGPPA